jgi:hypothetical protein
MKTLTCDVCGKIIQQPIHNRNYFHLAHRDICESCHDQLQLHIKPTIRTKQPFNYEWFNQFVQDSIETAIQKGKF